MAAFWTLPRAPWGAQCLENQHQRRENTLKRGKNKAHCKVMEGPLRYSGLHGQQDGFSGSQGVLSPPPMRELTPLVKDTGTSIICMNISCFQNGRVFNPACPLDSKRWQVIIQSWVKLALEPSLKCSDTFESMVEHTDLKINYTSDWGWISIGKMLVQHVPRTRFGSQDHSKQLWFYSEPRIPVELRGGRSRKIYRSFENYGYCSARARTVYPGGFYRSSVAGSHPPLLLLLWSHN